MMTFEQFVEEVVSTVEKDFGKKFVTEEVNKPTGSYVGMHTTEEGLCVCINLTNAYNAYTHGEMLEDVLETIEDLIEEEPPALDVDGIKSYDNVKDKLYVKLLNASYNAEFLESVPHRMLGDIAEVVYIDVAKDMCAAVTNGLLRAYGVDEETLFADALASAQTIRKPALIGLIPMMFGGDILGEFDEGCEVPDDDMIVITNTERMYGAACLLYPGLLKKVADSLKSDLYILPSSIHEVIIVRKEQEVALDYLENMVKEVNSTSVEEPDRLSDQILFFSRDEDKLMLARDTVAAV